LFRFRFFTRWIILASIIGVIAGFGAVGFFFMLEFSNALLLGYIGGYTTPTSGGEEHLFIFTNQSVVSWRIVLIITLGGLISGLIVYRFAPEAAGHGTDAYISAFHYNRGKIRSRVPLIKAIASALIIGSGGSAGREGPIAQIGAGGGSWLTSRLKLSDSDRRIALICGAAGGIGAIFKAPLGGAIFALEVLYKKDLESEGLLPSFISSTVAYAIFGLFFGFHPIFETPQFEFDIKILLLFIVLGIICAPIAIFYISFFYMMRDKIFISDKVPNYVKPAIGGFFVGLMALFLPEILGPGYGIIQAAIYIQIGLILLIILIFAKIIATSLTIGSGGSGGVFAPSLVIGALIGAAYALFLKFFLPLTDLEVGAFVIVGMAAFVAAVASVLIAPIIMVSEMTGTYSLLVPSMISCTISYILTKNWTIYRSQVPAKADSPVHRGEYTIDILEQILVEEVMTEEVIYLYPKDHLIKFTELLNKTGHMRFPVVDNNKLVGFLAYKDILKVPSENISTVLVEDIMSKDLITITPKENLSEALSKMDVNNHGHLPVVDPIDKTKIIGIITRQDIVRAHNIKRMSIFSQ
jgi:CIC family chloride channel protein